LSGLTNPKLARTLQVERGEHYKTENRMVLTRNYPVVIGAGVTVLLFSLVGAAAITGRIPGAGQHDENALPALEKTAAAAAAKRAACKTCGVIAAVKAVEVNEIEQPANRNTVYRVTVRMDDGSERTLSQAAAPTFGVGSRVRIVNGHALERG
jgi:hypothetical protein